MNSKVIQGPNMNDDNLIYVDENGVRHCNNGWVEYEVEGVEDMNFNIIRIGSFVKYYNMIGLVDKIWCIEPAEANWELGTSIEHYKLIFNDGNIISYKVNDCNVYKIDVVDPKEFNDIMLPI